MEKVLWIAEKESQLSGYLFGHSGPHRRSGAGLGTQRGEHWFIWLDGQVLQQAPPDHYLPDDALPLQERFGGWLIYLLSLELGHGSLQIHERRLVSQSLKNCCSGVMSFTTLVIPTRRVMSLMKPSSVLQFKKPVRRVLIKYYNATKSKSHLPTFGITQNLSSPGGGAGALLAVATTGCWV